jgi:aminobenzoyl-glutamate utilization protein B
MRYFYKSRWRRDMLQFRPLVKLFLLTLSIHTLFASDDNLNRLKTLAVNDVEDQAKLIQVMVDKIFSFGELGFQEFETSKYLTEILENNGFRVEKGISGIPTAWMAEWGKGKPVIALGSDIDGIPKSSQKPGVAFHDPIIEGAPGHGEGHNSGQAVIVVAAIVVKNIMEKENIKGTIRIWPGVAEELVATKAYFVRDGYFKDVDACIFTHVSSNLSTSHGQGGGNGLLSVEYTFQGKTAHSAGSPWRGKSALDAVELMNIGWNYRREHLRPPYRVHYVVTDGGDQPNVVPRNASVWYYLRELDYEHIMELFDYSSEIAEGAAKMSGTKLISTRILGSAWPRYFNEPIAQAMYSNIKEVGLPIWDKNDQALAKAVQKEAGNKELKGLPTELDSLRGPVSSRNNWGGGSDDIGDISWTVPTVTLRFPSNIPGLPGHNWLNGIAMATPIAHKGAVSGAKVTAMTLVDLFTDKSLIKDAKKYFKNQTKETKYQPMIRQTDKPAIELNKEIMRNYRDEMSDYYYDPDKYETYLDQLGIKYPTIKKKK